MSHPTRGVIMRLLHEQGPLSPIQAIKFLDGSASSLGSVAYHFRQLEKLELIENRSAHPAPWHDRTHAHLRELVQMLIAVGGSALAQALISR